MGYGLPAAIGACFGHGKKRVVCVHGDGGLELNVQELQTVAHYRLPVKLFVFNNQGYLSIKHTQQAYFNGRFVGSDPRSGLSCADVAGLARAYKIPYLKAGNPQELPAVIQKTLRTKGPVIAEILLDPLQPFIPKVMSERKKDGRMVSKPLEDMYPFLDRTVFKKEMIVKPLDQ
jgi:acetolactate synthase-1/2/3 large subunit